MSIYFSDNARIILEKRYLKKDQNGNVVESPEEMLKRVARSVASADKRFGEPDKVKKTEEEFYGIMSRLWFLPNSPTLMNAGRSLGQLAACFVLPVEDSMESIFETLKHMAIIHKSGGGTGFSFSRIRPANDIVSSTAGVSSGPVSFMNVYDRATDTVKQGGTRRGANMGILRIDHPDVEEFIRAKNEPGKLNNFNISIAVTDAFMSALEKKESFNLINPRDQETVKRLPASDMFHLIVDSAWNSGEPGIIYMDRVNAENPTPHAGRIEATNPCGEQPLLPYESCTLGSINLSRMVENGHMDYDRMSDCIEKAVHFLDNVIEINRYPLPVIREKSVENRKIGLGVMGFSDMLIKLGISYNSDEAVSLAEEVMSCINRRSREASARLAQKRGNFPNYPGSVYDNPETPAMRNATTTTIAPTGTISLIAGASSGIEPLFAVSHLRTVLEGKTFAEVHPLFEQMAENEEFYTEEVREKIKSKGHLADIPEIPERLKKLFVCSHEIDCEWHIRIQAAFQKHTDNSVSKTLNLSGDADREKVEQAFIQAYKSGCKGVTIYRYGSREGQVLTVGSNKEQPRPLAPRKRPEQTRGVTERIRTGCGNLYVTVNSDEYGICEVFAKMGKTGGCASSQIEAAGRLTSLALRSGIDPEAVVKQLIGIRCPSPSWQSGKISLSCPDAIAKVLKGMIGSSITEKKYGNDLCPECSNPMVYEEGCQICQSCGFSKCS